MNDTEVRERLNRVLHQPTDDPTDVVVARGRRRRRRRHVATSVVPVVGIIAVAGVGVAVMGDDGAPAPVVEQPDDRSPGTDTEHAEPDTRSDAAVANAIVAEFETLGLDVADDFRAHDTAVVLEPGEEFDDTRSAAERAEPALTGGLPVYLTVGPVEESFLNDKQDLTGASAPQERNGVEILIVDQPPEYQYYEAIIVDGQTMISVALERPETQHRADDILEAVLRALDA